MNTLVDLNTLELPGLFAELARTGFVRRLLELARDEDLSVGLDSGDITTHAWAPAPKHVRAALVAREPGVISGLNALPMLMQLLAPNATLRHTHRDGAEATRGAILATIDGPASEVLVLERTMLNLVGRLSGVATLTARFVTAAGAGSPVRVFDTRKTTPGLRVLEKYAVRCGGGCCHRLGLYDAMLVKDNHLAGIAPGELTQRAAEAARRARADRPLRFVEFEADTLMQVESLLRVEHGLIDVVLLDNMDTASLKSAVALRDRMNPSMLFEASGGVRLDTIRSIVETGVNRVSVGAITHSAVSLDLSLDAQ